MDKVELDLSFFKGKKVLVTGHNGFKGSWMCKILHSFGAIVAGYSLEPPTQPNLYDLMGLNSIQSIYGDVRDYDSLSEAINKIQPEIVFHLAAQSLVRESYQNPLTTFGTNVMGTVNLLECSRKTKSIQSLIIITTDKVYENNEWLWGYRENEPLKGKDPYSNSKSCSELVSYCYKESFFNNDNSPSISTARSGNVIGGGDFAKDRIIPDCVRAIDQNTSIVLRNPKSIRPYQHVLDCIYGYLLLAQKQQFNKKICGSYNFGPDDDDIITNEELVNLFCLYWGNNLSWISQETNGPYESSLLKLDCSKAKVILKWKPILHIEDAVKKTVEWTKLYLNSENISNEMDHEIEEYFGFR